MVAKKGVCSECGQIKGLIRNHPETGEPVCRTCYLKAVDESNDPALKRDSFFLSGSYNSVFFRPPGTIKEDSKRYPS